MVIQKESGTTELRVHQHGWADLPVPNSLSLVRQFMVDGWLIFSARPIMRCDGGRGKELLLSIAVSVTRFQTDSEGESPPGNSSRLRWAGWVPPKVVDHVESEGPYRLPAFPIPLMGL